MGESFLEVERLTKDFGGLRALNEASFTMGRQEILGMIGPNGAGKTTLLRLITGILKPDSGDVRFRGKKITGRKTWDIVNLGIACTFQNMRPFRRLPIIANVMVSCLSPRAMKRGEWVKKVEVKAMDALEFAGISDMALEKASTLSQGDLKRLEVARAVCPGACFFKQRARASRLHYQGALSSGRCAQTGHEPGFLGFPKRYEKLLRRFFIGREVASLQQFHPDHDLSNRIFGV